MDGGVAALRVKERRAMENSATDDRPTRVAEYEAVPGDPHEEVWICCPPSWKAPPDTWSVKRGHRIPNGSWQRAGEIPGADFPMQAIELAYKTGWYSTGDVITHIKRLLDLVAKS